MLFYGVTVRRPTGTIVIVPDLNYAGDYEQGALEDALFNYVNTTHHWPRRNGVFQVGQIVKRQLLSSGESLDDIVGITEVHIDDRRSSAEVRRS